MLKKRILAIALSMACAVSTMSLTPFSVGAKAADAPELGALEAGAVQMAYVDFSNPEMPDGVTISDNGNVTIQDGYATMSDGDTNSGGAITFDRAKLLGPMQTHTTIIAEAVVRFSAIAKHEVVFSMGTGASGQPHLVMGMHEHGNIKCNSTNTEGTDFETDTWYKVKYVVSDAGTQLYVDGEMVADNPDDTQVISSIPGDLVFGKHTVTGWADPSFTGDVSEIRLSVTGSEASVAKLQSASMFDGTVNIYEDTQEVVVDNMLKYADKSKMKLVAAGGGTAVLSADGSSITVTSADKTQTKVYSVLYNEVDQYTIDRTEGPWNSKQITDAAELSSQGNFTNLDPSRTYKLALKLQLDLTGVAEDAAGDTLIIGHSPCVYDVYDGADHETGWDGGASWSAGIYNYYITGGMLTLDELRALTEDEDGYVRISTLVGPETFKYDPTGMTSMKIQGRIEGLKNLSGMQNQFGEIVGDTETRTFTAPDGISVSFFGYELELVPDNRTDLAAVTVNGVAATVDNEKKTVSVELPAGANPATAKVDVQLAGAGEYTVAADNKTITVTAQDGTQTTYTLNITVKSATPTPGGTTPGGTTGGTTGGNKPGAPNVSTPKNGTANVGGKLTLYKNSKKVTGTKVVKVGKTSYALKNSVVQTSGKATYKVVKIGKKSYVVNKKGAVQKKKMLKVGKRRYVVNASGVVQKAKKKYAVAKVGKKTYIVNKKGFVQMKKKTFKVGKKTYKVGKNGVAKKK